MSENKNIEKSTNFIFEGNISVKAALEAKHRRVFSIYYDKAKKDRDLNYILKLASKNNVAIYARSRSEIDLLAKGKSHGGIIAEVGERIFQEIDYNQNFYALLEGIEDPYNFAHILRALYAAGCSGVILSPRNWNSASDLLAKTSAGASERISMFISEDFTETLKSLHDHAFEIIACDRRNAKSLYEHTFQAKSVICIGGEMRGLSKSVLDASNQNLFIPYLSSFKNALTSVSATSVIAFEYVRQINKE